METAPQRREAQNCGDTPNPIEAPMSSPSYWLSPFRHRTVWEPVLDESGNPSGDRRPREFFVADVAPTRLQKRQSIEIAFPAAVLRAMPKPKRDHLIKVRIAAALATLSALASQ
jgi:hypothetical protein